MKDQKQQDVSACGVSSVTWGLLAPVFLITEDNEPLGVISKFLLSMKWWLYVSLMRCDSRQRRSVSLFLCVLYLTRFSAQQLFMLTAEGPLGTLVKGVMLQQKTLFFCCSCATFCSRPLSRSSVLLFRRHAAALTACAPAAALDWSW